MVLWQVEAVYVISENALEKIDLLLLYIRLVMDKMAVRNHVREYSHRLDSENFYG